MVVAGISAETFFGPGPHRSTDKENQEPEKTANHEEIKNVYSKGLWDLLQQENPKRSPKMNNKVKVEKPLTEKEIEEIKELF